VHARLCVLFLVVVVDVLFYFLWEDTICGAEGEGQTNDKGRS